MRELLRRSYWLQPKRFSISLPGPWTCHHEFHVAVLDKLRERQILSSFEKKAVRDSGSQKQPALQVQQRVCGNLGRLSTWL